MTPRDTVLAEGVIANLELFRGVLRNTVAELARRSRVLHVRRSATLIHRGDAVPGMLALAYGSIKLALRPPEGGERVIRLVKPRDTFYEASALVGKPCPLDAVALTDSMVVVIPTEAVQGLLEREAEFARSIVLTLAERGLHLLAEVESISMHRGAQRLACFLESCAQRGENGGRVRVRLPATKTLIASQLGMKKETLSRLLRELVEDRILELHGSEIWILDPERLQSLSRGQRPNRVPSHPPQDRPLVRDKARPARAAA